MTSTHFPAHKICYISKADRSFLLAATGPCIQTIDLSNNKIVSVWPRDHDAESDEDIDNSQERPLKRLKLENGTTSLSRHESEASEASIEISAEEKRRAKGERRKPKTPAEEKVVHVSHLIVTRDSDHAIVLTAEDKALRVFTITDSGHLVQLSSRIQPKKSCAVILSQDEKTILTADKFGDVYALPLCPSDEFEPKVKTEPIKKPYQPSATELTVHTKGNRDALRQQQERKSMQPRKEGPDYEYKILLGHVSLLTDIAVADVIVDGRSRSFLFTSDRDEHIRVSRSIPQTHIIHSYCLGSSEFISKLCILPWNRRILVAGTGEPSLRLYDWMLGLEKAVFTPNQDSDVLKVKLEKCLEGTNRDVSKLSVSGIWPISNKSNSPNEGKIYVALEAVPLLLVFKVTDDFKVFLEAIVELEGALLDVTTAADGNTIYMSIDRSHSRGSLRQHRKEAEHQSIYIHSAIKETYLTRSDVAPLVTKLENPQYVSIKAISCESLPDKRESTGYEQGKGDYSALGEHLYGLENLRKRRGKAAEEAEDEDEEEDMTVDKAPLL